MINFCIPSDALHPRRNQFILSSQDYTNYIYIYVLSHIICALYNITLSLSLYIYIYIYIYISALPTHSIVMSPPFCPKSNVSTMANVILPTIYSVWYQYDEYIHHHRLTRQLLGSFASFVCMVVRSDCACARGTRDEWASTRPLLVGHTHCP